MWRARRPLIPLTGSQEGYPSNVSAPLNPYLPAVSLTMGYTSVRTRKSAGLVQTSAQTGITVRSETNPTFDSCSSGWPGWARPRACVRRFDQVLTDINFLPVLETQHGVRHVDASEARDLLAVVFAIGHENVQRDHSFMPRIHVNRAKVAG